MVEVAVIPAAGFGTRVFPASKAVSKELFPLYNKPAIHYIVSECVRAGIKEVILVLSKRKMDIFRYFEEDKELEDFLKNKGKENLLTELQEFKDIKIDYVIQEKQLGLGHAVLCAREKVKERNFAVLLPDDICIQDGKIGIIDKMISIFEEMKPQGGVILVKKVPKKEVRKYGVIKTSKKEGDIMYVSGVVEKPSPESAPSSYAVIGRYVFTPLIFDWLSTESPDNTGEIQLAGACGRLSFERENSIIAYIFKGKWLDLGSPEGYTKAVKEISKLYRL